MRGEEAADVASEDSSCAWARICQTISSFIRTVPRSTGDAGATLPSRCQRGRRRKRQAAANSFFPKRSRDGGARRVRTDDLMLAKHALYQLSYGPLPGAQQERVAGALPKGHTKCGGPRRTRTADLTLIRRVL